MATQAARGLLCVGKVVEPLKKARAEIMVFIVAQDMMLSVYVVEKVL